ncbi:hypothetical protein Scep_018083 [Stephania cephalantha]|uniref:Uncharacterized protein n=1 Tax=Stephania cephalantha TaxID=152367 RepID=A0AAP0IRA7_9MAGN
MGAYMNASLFRKCELQDVGFILVKANISGKGYVDYDFAQWRNGILIPICLLRLFKLGKVAERALFLWNNDHIEGLIKQNRKVILPIIFPALERNARTHWNQAVQSLTLNVRKIFSDLDPELFEECLVKFQEDEAKENEKKAKREAVWKRLEEIAASKATSNEAVLVRGAAPPHASSG